MKPSSLDTASYLLRYDRGTLSDQARARLLGWLGTGMCAPMCVMRLMREIRVEDEK